MRDREIDGTASQRVEHLPMGLPTMVQKAVEIKAGRDKTSKSRNTFEKGRSQIVGGHLGKELLFAFDFGGAGQNAEAVGVCLTPLSIEVINMRITGIGTEEVDLGVAGTDRVPLLGTDNLSEKQKGELLSKDMNGFVLLAGALKHDCSQAFDDHDSVKQVYPVDENLNVVRFLGSGAFSNVVALAKTGEFMKMPKTAPLTKNLYQEAAILQKLQRDEGSSSIPRLVVGDTIVSRLRTVMRGEISDVAGLRMSGVVGLPLYKLPRNVWTSNAAFIITTKVYEALQYARRKSIYHLNVRPGNIIVDFLEEYGCRVMLSDWGCSVDGIEIKLLPSFRGCTPYAHDRFLGNKFQGKLKLGTGLFPLSYTVDHCQLRWILQFDGPRNVNISDLKLRRQLVSEWIDDDCITLLSPEIRNVMKSSVGDLRRSSTRDEMQPARNNP